MIMYGSKFPGAVHGNQNRYALGRRAVGRRLPEWQIIYFRLYFNTAVMVKDRAIMTLGNLYQVTLICRSILRLK